MTVSTHAEKKSTFHDREQAITSSAAASVEIRILESH